MFDQPPCDILVLDRGRELHDMLAADGHRVSWIPDPMAAAGQGDLHCADLTLLDLDIGPAEAGLELCDHLTDAWPDAPVVAITGHTDLERAVSAMRCGAYDLIQRPVSAEQLQRSVRRTLRHRQLRRRLQTLSEAAVPLRGLDGLIGTSAAMTAMYSTISRAANSDISVLIVGETGTGKELVARTLHRRSNRRDGPFVAVNCAALPAQLLESELFGHTKGAFTSAHAARDGLFITAHGGTLFLDEISEMPVELQAKLLRVLQERMVRPIGASTERPVDVRVVAATNRDLLADVATCHFREDLYYRISGLQITVPRLRERGNDVLHLAEHFLEVDAARMNRPVRRLSPACTRAFLCHSWPGNVRELQNAIERAVTLSRGEDLDVADLPEQVSKAGPARPGSDEEQPATMPSLRALRTSYINQVLNKVGQNRTRAARILGINRRTLYRHLESAEKER